MTAPSDAQNLLARAKLLGAELTAERATQLLGYLDAMLLLNEQINLTAVRDREAAVVLHALDGLAFARTGLTPRHVLDLGSGNGFPGVAIATLHPTATVVLMDKTGKKVRAIGSCLVSAGLTAVETVQMDAAQAPGLRRELRHAFDTVVARAVGKPDLVGELAAPLLRPGGHLVLWLDADADVPPQVPHGRLEQRIRYALPEPAARERQLGVYRRFH